MRFLASLLGMVILAPLSQAAAQAPADPGFGGLAGIVPIAVAAGKKIKLTGYIKTDRVEGPNRSPGYAGLWWRGDRDGNPPAFDNMAGRGASGTSAWRRYQVQLSMPKDVTNINFGVLLGGGGTAWFADLKIEIDDQPYTTEMFDAGLTSSPPLGFKYVGKAYEWAVDSFVLYNGKPTFRIRR